MSLRHDVMASLQSERRAAFLAALALHLSTGARGSYVEAGNSPEVASAELRCHNELLQVVSTQLGASLGGAVGYPDDAFLDTLVSASELFGDCGSSLRWALEQALRSTGSAADPAAGAVPVATGTGEPADPTP